jgi:EAL domain-containing protein (putative c-di-GMP-specific phosphodiesterase class I)/GGDEF domain-containing protein
MSLIKQLWIAIAVVTALAFGGSLVISTLSARHYLEQQLHVKNLDNASALAMSLSQLPKDAVTVELQVAAQFDTGHYRRIRLDNPNGEVIVEREYAGGETGAPAWFARLVPIDARAGIAQVQDGWRQFGTLTLESHSRYAYAALWQGTLMLLGWFVAGAGLTGLVGTVVVRQITRPLGRVVEQAQALGDRRFVTTPEPRTVEFRNVVRAMNTLSERVRTMLAEESARLEQMRRQHQHDELTGLFNRRQFMNLLDAALSTEDGQGGALAIARVVDLAALNRRLGRTATDRLLQDIGERFVKLGHAAPGREAGRLNATDFALLAVDGSDVAALAAEITALLEPLRDERGRGEPLQWALGIGSFAGDDTRTTLLARIDGALASAEQDGERAVRIAPANPTPPFFTELAEWRVALEAAIADARIDVARFPVVATDGTLLHREAPLRAMIDGNWCNAGRIVPWAVRLGLMARLDAAVVRTALERIVTHGEALAVNVSIEAVCDAVFRSELCATLQSRPDAARLLWLEVPEAGVVRHPGEFRSLYLALKPLGCRLGIEHVGRRFSRIGDLHDLGLDYIKVDAAMIRDIDRDPGNQSFLRGLCVIAHAIGLTVIAEGVVSDEERAMLPGLGIDGLTGPAIREAEQV